MDTLTLAIIGHLVGDYLLQTDWMALNKKTPGPEGNMACVVHCCLWSMSVILFSGWYRASHLLAVCVVLFLTHYLQDRTQVVVWWMRLKWKSQEKFCQPPMAPWSIIVVDNVWHIVALWAIGTFLV